MKSQRASVKTLLVAGGAGFVGSEFVRLAVEGGHGVIVLDSLTYAGHRENLEGISGPGKHELIVGDIRDRDLVYRLLTDRRPDALLNFAAESHVDTSISEPAAFIGTNIVGTYALLSAALDHWRSLSRERGRDFRYLQVSTDEVFGSLGETGRFSETSPYAPSSPYSASKASADLLVNAWHRTYGLPAIITNCSNNYGPRQFPEKLIPHMINLALGEKPLPVYGQGENVRDWLHVHDHCQGILLALELGKTGSRYCFGGASERKNIEIVRAICRELDLLKPRPGGKKYEELIIFVADRPGHDWRYAIDDALAQRELGFKRRYGFEDGLAETIRWYLGHQDWMESVLSKGSAS